MRKTDSLAIIVPTYNRAHTLPRALESVLRQTDARWRLIVVDDGSTDRTSEVLSTYRDERILYHHYSHNCGASYARNRGVEFSTSEYVAFLDSDDELVPEAVEQVFSVLDETERLYWLYRFPVLDDRIGRLPSKSGTVITYMDVLTKKYDADTFAVIRRQAFDFYRFCENFLGYEKVFWFSILKYLGPEYFVAMPLGFIHRNTHGGSIMQSLSKRTRGARENSKRQSLKYLELFGEDLLAVNRKDFQAELTKLCIAHLHLGEYREAMEKARRTFIITPSLRFILFMLLARMETSFPLEIQYKIRRLIINTKEMVS
jgi:glycosyltransferase involved in cell wall biosynthesis